MAERRTRGVVNLMGPQGSGKSFHGKWIRDGLYYKTVGMGDILRTMQTEHPDTFPSEVARRMQHRELVPDHFVVEIFIQYSQQMKAATQVLFEGFPRTKEQATAFSIQLAHRDPLVIVLDVDVDEAVERIMKAS